MPHLSSQLVSQMRSDFVRKSRQAKALLFQIVARDSFYSSSSRKDRGEKDSRKSHPSRGLRNRGSLVSGCTEGRVLRRLGVFFATRLGSHRVSSGAGPAHSLAEASSKLPSFRLPVR